MLENKKKYYWVILIGFILIIFISRGLKPLESGVFIVIKPVATFFSGAGNWFGEKFSLFSNIKEIKETNEELSNENLKLKFQLSEFKETENENQILREELDLREKREFNSEESLIIGQNLSENRRIIYLDKGSKDGIKAGSPVIVGEGILVGQISKVYLNGSEAELILDKNIRINSEIQENQIKGIIQGRYGTTVNMEMIPQTAELEKGQTVITSGLGGKFPRGLLIGYVDSYRLTVDQLFQSVSLKLPVDFNDLRIVGIIKD